VKGCGGLMEISRWRGVFNGEFFSFLKIRKQ